MACSTAKAVEWDAAWANNLDPSGRAALGVHAAAYDEVKEKTQIVNDSMNSFPQKLKDDVVMVANAATTAV